MEEMIARGWEGLAARVGGPMTFRLILQPLMATLLALRAGLKDAREDRPPYFLTVLTDPAQRAELLREGWKSIARVFFLAIIMDVIYQWIMQHWLYPLETMVVAILLAVVPYVLIRGPVNRIARRRRSFLQD
jgi:Flp pilus assembly protein TadB